MKGHLEVIVPLKKKKINAQDLSFFFLKNLEFKRKILLSFIDENLKSI